MSNSDGLLAEKPCWSPGVAKTSYEEFPGEEFMGKISRCQVPQTPSRTRSKHLVKLGFTRGQTMLEFAMVAPIFFFLIFAIFDFGRLFFVQMNLEQAVFEAGRFASTGNHVQDPNNPGQTLSRVASIIQVADQAAMGLGANISNIQISSLNGGAGSAGGPGDTVTITLTANLPLMTPFVGRFFPSGVYTFTSSSSFKNEPFPPGETK
jgi:Flp pilus assembly protein TadG